MTSIRCLVLSVSSVSAFWIAAWSNGEPGRPLPTSLGEQSRGLSIEVSKVTVTCTAYNAFAAQCIGAGDNKGCDYCSGDSVS